MGFPLLDLGTEWGTARLCSLIQSPRLQGWHRPPFSPIPLSQHWLERRQQAVDQGGIRQTDPRNLALTWVHF